MEMKVERQEFNPWDVVSIFDFTYYLYCCPECDWKEPSKQEFVNHALTYHPWVSYKFYLFFTATLESGINLAP
jgi:hypothetical protein